MEDQAFSLSYELAPLPPSPPLSRQQVVSLSESCCVSPIEFIDERWRKRGVERSQILRRRESLVLCKSFYTFCWGGICTKYCVGNPESGELFMRLTHCRKNVCCQITVDSEMRALDHKICLTQQTCPMAIMILFRNDLVTKKLSACHVLSNIVFRVEGKIKFRLVWGMCFIMHRCESAPWQEEYHQTPKTRIWKMLLCVVAVMPEACHDIGSL